MNSLLTPTPFANCSSFAVIAQSETVTFEMCGNFQKQTFRNRFYIYAANGKLQLNIPVIYSQKNRELYKDIKIFNEEKWQLNHWKSFESAYKTSPFFEYYEDEIKPLYTTDFKYLIDFNKASFDIICECLQLQVETNETKDFEKEVGNKSDYRALAERKSKGFNLEQYNQVFNDKHGYISNLSILDLLFNEGPNALNYLESQTLPNATV